MRHRSLYFALVLLWLGYFLTSCEKQLQKRVVFQIGSIDLDRDVVVRGDPVNVTANFIITGTTNERSPSVTWESSQGSFESANRISTIWYAPVDFIGDVKIKLTATFMGHTDIAERAVRIVNSPAQSWGSVSGYLFDEGLAPLSNIIVIASTGEGDTTDNQGFFYISYLPQGNNGLEFNNIPFSWATELTQQITVNGGSHQHLGNILFYSSTPAEISGIDLIPERRAILTIQHQNPGLINFHEIYQATDAEGTDATLIQSVEPGILQIQIQNESKYGFYAMKSIPNNGEQSPFSEWTTVEFLNVVDPPVEGSYIVNNNFFSSTIFWQPTGYESYYKGFRVVQDLDTGWAWVSPLISTNTTSYNLQTTPDSTGIFYILAISTNGLYNETQPENQKINLKIPSLSKPSDFRGSVRQDFSIRLLWEPLSNNNTWYSGYLLERKVVTDTSTINWEELVRLDNTLTGSYTDTETDSGNDYHYRIRSIAYPNLPGEAYLSDADSLVLSTK